jgi:hypothetical protein
MNVLNHLDTVRLVKTGPSLRERLERWIPAAHRATVVGRLRRFREELECEMEPEPWTGLEAPMVLLLSDVCDALALSEDERSIILGQQGERALAEILETRVTPRPPCSPRERRSKALAHVQEHGKINIGAYRQLCPGLSDETLRLDLVDLVRRGVLVKNGAKKGTYYTAVV